MTCDLRWIDSLSIFVPARPRRPGSSVIAAAIATVTTERHRHAHRGDGRQAGEEQAEDRDDDGGAGEEHRLAGGGVRSSGCVVDAHALVEILAVPGDDEQRVVDPDTEADHRAQDQREFGDVHDGRQHSDGGGADEDAEECRHDRKAHRDHRAEREQQHDDRDADADQLAARDLTARAARARR